MSADVAVVGSVNLDVVVPVERHPAPGETVLGGDHEQLPGRQGRQPGRRRRAARARRGLRRPRRRRRRRAAGCAPRSRREGVDVRHLRDDDEAPSGLAMISVAPRRREHDRRQPGRQRPRRARPTSRPRPSCCAPPRSRSCSSRSRPSAVQPRRPRAPAGTLVLNPAPARALEPELLRRADVLVPNRTELALLAGADAARGAPTRRRAVAARLDGPARCGRHARRPRARSSSRAGSVEHVPAPARRGRRHHRRRRRVLRRAGRRAGARRRPRRGGALGGPRRVGQRHAGAARSARCRRAPRSNAPELHRVLRPSCRRSAAGPSRRRR